MSSSAYVRVPSIEMISTFFSTNLKNLLLTTLYCLVVFNYNTLRITKDTLLITAPHSGATVLPYIKLWAMLPASILSMVVFSRLSNKVSSYYLFQIIVAFFAIFFFIFPIVVYPFSNILHPHALADQMQSLLPNGLSGFISIFRNWTFSAFYITCELWGTCVMTMLFWGYANSVVSLGDAKKLYSVLGVIANMTTILSGQVTSYISSQPLKGYISHDLWGESLLLICWLSSLIALICMFAYHKLISIHPAPLQKPNSPRVSMGLQKNFSYLLKSRYLMSIASIVIMYNVSLNIIDIVWKNQVHIEYPDASNYNAYMSKALTYLGIMSTLFGIIMVSLDMINKLGWTTVAYITPVISLISGAFLFFCLNFKDIGGVGYILAMAPISSSTMLGGIQDCLSRASKFTFFDVTKEMAFIPLSEESKLKGKTAIDGVVSRIGKSGGSMLYQTLLICCGSISASMPYVTAIFILITSTWLFSVRYLGKRFEVLSLSPNG